MATTSPDNIYYPTSSNQIAPLETVFSTLAASVQTALNAKQSAINALDNRLDAIEADAGKLDKLPRAVATGTVGNTTVPAGGNVTTNISFPAGRFSSTPVVTVTPVNSARDITAYASSVTATGFTLNRGSMSIVNRSAGAHWHAILY